MRAYELVRNGAVLAFAGSQGEATKSRLALMHTHDIRRSEIDIKEAEIPTDKAGLLTYLNTLVKPS